MTRPWGVLSVLGEKEWETRPRRFHHYGHTAIHSSDGFPKSLLALYPGGLREVCSLPFFSEALSRHGYDSIELLPVSAVIGIVEIVRYAPTASVRDLLSEKERAFGLYTDGRWAYRFANPRQLLSPVSCKGQLGLWNLPARVVRQIRRENPGLDLGGDHTLPFA